MKKVVINRCHGGFGLSDEAMKLYAERKSGKEIHCWKLGACSMFTTIPQAEYEAMRDEVAKRKGSYAEVNEFGFHDFKIGRTDPVLIEIVEEMGRRANGDCADLKVVEVPDDLDYEIEDHAGAEWISECHRRWS